MSDTSIVYRSEWPDFSIQVLRGTSTSRGYHETFFEVKSRHPLDEKDWAHLDAAGLIGIGQAYSIESTQAVVAQGIPTLISKRTGEVVPGPCVDYAGREVTKSIGYDYTRYVVKRICDSGD